MHRDIFRVLRLHQLTHSHFGIRGIGFKVEDLKFSNFRSFSFRYCPRPEPLDLIPIFDLRYYFLF